MLERSQLGRSQLGRSPLGRSQYNPFQSLRYNEKQPRQRSKPISSLEKQAKAKD